MVNFNLDIKKIFADKLYMDKSIYRNKIKSREKYNWQITFRFSDLLVSCNKNVSSKIVQLVKEIYGLLDSVIREEPSFQKSLSPVKIKENHPPVIKKMCLKSALFNVGPMAAVAGAVCDYIASGLNNCCERLIIENGGDIYIRSTRDVDVGVYLKNKNFKDTINIKIKAKSTPCGLCSSSGAFGHSLSLGKSDLVTVLSHSTISADAAATSIANRIGDASDIGKIIEKYKEIKDINGILIVKDNKLGIWGNIELIDN